MGDFFTKVPVRIPVRFVGGEWEYFYGGGVPVKPRTVGHFVVNQSSISDPKFLSLLKRRSDHKILDEGAELLVALSIRPDPRISPALLKHLVAKEDLSHDLGTEFYSELRPTNTKFVRIHLTVPTKQQRASRDKKGGLWLRIEGTQPKGVSSSTVRVPTEVWAEPLDSLNHAFTKLSEIYEPWRKAHTGNIYTRVLYREKNNKWYPLQVLRDAALATDEHALIKQLWSDLVRTLAIK